jgi:Tol biopolymer transport system component
MRDVYIYELERAQLNRLTREGITWESAWRPDGDRIAIMSGHPAGQWSLFWAPTDFSEQPELLHLAGQAIPASWSPDGRSLLFYDHSEAGIFVLSPDGDRTRRQVAASGSNARFPALSADGNWMAYVADESGRREVFVQSFPDLGPRYKVSIDGGGEPVWSRDGRQLFFREGDQMFALDIVYRPSFRAGAPRALFNGRYDDAPIGHQHYDISADGERFLMVKHGEPAGPSEVRVVLNWSEELQTVAPLRGSR